jgi:hypothetical protein
MLRENKITYYFCLLKLQCELQLLGIFGSLEESIIVLDVGFVPTVKRSRLLYNEQAICFPRGLIEASVTVIENQSPQGESQTRGLPPDQVCACKPMFGQSAAVSVEKE